MKKFSQDMMDAMQYAVASTVVEPVVKKMMAMLLNPDKAYKPGDRVYHLTDNRIPQGQKGTILRRVPPSLIHEDHWEVEYDDWPHPGKKDIENLYGALSMTSWFSRAASIAPLPGITDLVVSKDQMIRRDEHGRLIASGEHGELLVARRTKTKPIF